MIWQYFCTPLFICIFARNIIEFMANSQVSNWVRTWVFSKYLDVFSAILIFSVSVGLGYQSTLYKGGKVLFNVSFSDWVSQMKEGAFPLGIFSIVGAIFSVLATRLVGKQNNLGNFIAIFTTINSGVIDYILGNKAAIITYPVTFIITILYTYNWSKGIKIRKVDTLYFVLLFVSMTMGVGLTLLGFYLFSDTVITPISILTSVVLGFSFFGNLATIFKYKETFFNWFIYNLIQLIKNSLQLNIPYVVKFLFYLINSLITFFDWNFNGDISQRKSQVSY